MDLYSLTDEQLRQLPANSTIPPQAINGEILRRSQLRRSAGDGELPAMADVQTNPNLNPMLQNTWLGQMPPMQMPAQPPGAKVPQPELMSMLANSPQMSSNSSPRPEFAPINWSGVGNAATAAASAVPGPMGMMAQLFGNPETRDAMRGMGLDILNAGAGDRPVDDVAPIVDTSAPPELAAFLQQQQNAQMAAFGGGGGGPRSPLNLDTVTPDYAKYVEQLKRELPDNTGELRDAVDTRKAAAQKVRDNAFSQAMMQTGLSMLGSNRPLLEALGDAGKLGLQQFNSQRDTAERLQQDALQDQHRVESLQAARDAAISQGATIRGGEDIRAQQMNKANELQSWIAQNGAAMQRAELAGMRAGAMSSNPAAKWAIEEFKASMRLAEQLMSTPGKEQQAFEVAQRAREALRRTLGGQSVSGLPLMQESTEPAARVRAM